MTQAQPGGTTGAAAVVTRKRRFGLVWLIPSIAAGIGAWLAFDAIWSRGPQYSISFETADGLVAGKTRVKFKAVDVGSVVVLEFSEKMTPWIAPSATVARTP